MAKINIVGFEMGDNSEGVSSVGTFSVQGTTKRTGDYALQVNPTTTATGYFGIRALTTTGAAVVASVTDSYSRVYFRYATKPSANSEEILYVRSNSRGGAKCQVRIDSSGNLGFYDKTATVVSTGSTVLAADTWYLIELSVGTGATASWELKINGVSEISGTADLGTDNTGDILLGKVVNRNGNTVDFFYDDFSWDDTAYPGAGAVVLLKPNANGNYQTWTALGLGDHYVEVDEIPHDSDTSYLYTPLIGLTADTEGLESSSDKGVSGTVNTVKNLAVVKRDGASNGAVTLRIRSGSTDNDTASNYATTSAYALIAKLYETDPDTSAAWTVLALNSLESGCVSQDTTNVSRMTSCGVMVDFTAFLRKTKKGLAIASVKIFKGTAIASVKNDKGLA